MGTEVSVEKDGGFTLHGDKVLLSVGRRPVTKGSDSRPFPRTVPQRHQDQRIYADLVPEVYAAGDINAVSLLAHTAEAGSSHVVDHILGGSRKMSYDAIPGVVYTNPELAGVGKTEES